MTTATSKRDVIRFYLLTCGCEWRNTEVWPVGTLVTCTNHEPAPGCRPCRAAHVVKKLRKTEEI